LVLYDAVSEPTNICDFFVCQTVEADALAYGPEFSTAIAVVEVGEGVVNVALEAAGAVDIHADFGSLPLDPSARIRELV
jgi:hypothetical protein